MLAQALTLAPETLKIDIRIFVTGSRASDNSDLRSYDWAEESGSIAAESTLAQTPVSEKEAGILTSDSVSVLSDFSSVRVSHGRPAMAKLLIEEAEETRGGSMWVTGRLYLGARSIIVIFPLLSLRVSFHCQRCAKRTPTSRFRSFRRLAWWGECHSTCRILRICMSLDLRLRLRRTFPGHHIAAQLWEEELPRPL